MASSDHNVLDLTEDPERAVADEDNEHRIRLHSGITVSHLLRQNEGVIFEPEIDESLFQPRMEDRDYFYSAGEDIDDRLSRVQEDQMSEETDDEELSAFENKARRMTDLIPGGGIKKRILVKGLEGEGKPTPHGTVTIHYSLYLEGQDESYDSTVLRGRPERYRLDDCRLLLGMEMAIKSMQKREKAEFLIEPDYAFGRMGCPPRVPAEAQILASIEMLNFVQEAATDALLSMAPDERRKVKSFEEIILAVKVENQEGNNYVREGEIKLAAKRYENGIRLLEDVEMKNDEDEATQKHHLIKFLLNHAHCCIKIHRPKAACLDMQKALELDPRNAKALYRMGKAKRMLGNLEDARRYLQRAQRVVPGDTDVGQELAAVDKQIRDEDSNQRALCQRMFPGAQRPQQTDRLYVDDEFQEDMYHAVKVFQENSLETRMFLPQSLDQAEIQCAQRIAEEFSLRVVTSEGGGVRQLVIIKEGNQ